MWWRQWDTVGHSSNIQHRTLALCSGGFSAREVLTELLFFFFLVGNQCKEFFTQEKNHKVLLAE